MLPNSISCCANHYRLLGILLFTPLLFLEAAAGQTGFDQFRPTAWKSAATLNDVFFFDPDIGYAVGDHGLILRTSDGGRNWEISNSGVTCDLQAVFFIDDKTGWVVGGISNSPLPDDDSPVQPSQGIVLRTIDGGLHWVPTESSLPALNDVYFADAKEGIAVGDASHFFSAGLFYTSDGGQSWRSGGADKLESFARVDVSGNEFQLLTTHSQIASLENAKTVRQSITPADSHRRLTDFAFAGQQYNGLGIAVGSQGTVMQRTDATGDWQPCAAARSMSSEFKSVEIRGNHCWLAGEPGTKIFRLDLQSGRLESFPTGQNSGIRRLFFLDQNRGWAVGENGTVLRTRDGGKSWERQRGEDRAATILLVTDDPSQIPFGLIAKYAGEEGLKTTIVWLDPQLRREEISRARHAASLLGNSSFYYLQQRSHQDRDAIEKLTAVIRSTRPQIIVSSRANRPTMALDVDQVTLAAVHSAADRYKFPRQIEELGLAEWQVKRLLVDCGQAAAFDVSELTSQVLIRTGGLLSDQIQLSRAIVGCRAGSEDLYLMDLLPTNQYKTRQLIAPSLIRDRKTAKASTARVEQLKKVTNKRQLMGEMISWKIGDHSLRKWQPKLLQFIQSLDEQTAGQWLAELAQQYWESGDADSSIATHQALIRLFPNHWKCDHSLIWLVDHFSGAEVQLVTAANAQANGKRNSSDVIQAGGFRARQRLVRIDGQTRMIWEPVNSEDDTVQPAGNLETVESNPALSLEQANQYLGALRQRSFHYSSHPRLDFAAATIHRKGSSEPVAPTIFRQVSQALAVPHSIRFIAAREAELLQSKPKLTSSTTTLTCATVSSKPFLDGILDDRCWQQSEAHALRMPADQQLGSTRLIVTRDREYIYIAIDAKQQNPAPAKSGTKRKRDPDLSRSDRVILKLDLDRDFHTWFEIGFDEQGRVAENVVGNPAWNPTVYVAHAQTSSGWTIEAAIPVSEWTQPTTSGTQNDLFGQFWGFSVVRRHRQASRSWPQKADDRPYGTLHFR